MILLQTIVLHQVKRELLHMVVIVQVLQLEQLRDSILLRLMLLDNELIQTVLSLLPMVHQMQVPHLQ